MGNHKFTNKEISWLCFNERLLQEAEDESVPLIERLKFLGIYSSNMDEFFRVRVATLVELTKLGKKAIAIIDHDPDTVLKDVQEIVLKQSGRFVSIYQRLLETLAVKHNIFIIDETKLNTNQKEYVKSYFDRKVHSRLFPIMMNSTIDSIELKDESIYFIVTITRNQNAAKPRLAIIEIPTSILPRFVILPEEGPNQYIILLDDVIRFNLGSIFSMFDYDHLAAYQVKLTRNAELDIDNDLSESILKKISRSLRQRKQGEPVRFVYDQTIPSDLLKYIIKKLEIEKGSSIIPGGRYHNYKDLIHFPEIKGKHLRYEKYPPIPHKDLTGQSNLFNLLKKKDVLLHFPYHSFDNIIALLREASMDPKVESIRITIYRVAKQSSVINALINAVKNGKIVTVVLELKARFDEEANIKWANLLRDEGVFVSYGIPELKIHAKMISIKRIEKGKPVYYSGIGTGNFNEDTAKIYTDHILLTADPVISNDVKSVFDFLSTTYKAYKCNALILSPFNSRENITKLIKKEILNVQTGKTGEVTIKLNNLVDPEIITRLYEASQAGVKVRLLVRGMFSLLPGVPGLSENIEARGILDKYLEHSRIFIFHNVGDKKVFISSADFMERNFDKRIEVICPVYDDAIKEELINIVEIQWRDNVKSRIINKELNNCYYKNDSGVKIRAQVDIYDYIRNLKVSREEL